MHALLYVFPYSAILLEGLLLWRLIRHGQCIRYPHVTLFVAFDLLSNIVLFLIDRSRPAWFADAYWRIASISLFLRFLVNWEFFRGVFPRRSTLHDIASRIVVTVVLSTLPAIGFLGWKQASSLPYVYLHFSPAVEQYVSLGQAVLLLAAAAIAWYYRIPLGKNLRGLSLGFGIFLLLRVVNFASLQVFRGFGSYWRVLTPMTFIGMVAIWLWAFWQFAPSPERWSMDEISHTQWKTEWQQLWVRIRKALPGGTC
jgi:hypothetical protein